MYIVDSSKEELEKHGIKIVGNVNMETTKMIQWINRTILPKKSDYYLIKLSDIDIRTCYYNADRQAWENPPNFTYWAE